MHDYYSEAEHDTSPTASSAASGATQKDAGTPKEPAETFTAHRDAIFDLGRQVPALAAAYLLTRDERFGHHAASHLRAWFINPETRMTPQLDYGGVLTRTSIASNQDSAAARNRSREVLDASGPPKPTGRFEGILDTLPLVEVAQAIPFLHASLALTEADQASLHAWFNQYLHWLTDPEDTGPRLAALARDQKDHHGTSWLLQASAYARYTAPEGSTPKSDDNGLAELRHRFRTVTLRAQISADGNFPHELTSDAPYRNSLFNLDMLAAVCELLSTRFESVWQYELEDGPGMRAAIAYHFPFIANRAKWPFRADSAHFDELPGRRPSLLFCARAYQRPEYAALWQTLPPDPVSPEILRTIPIHQPLLWVRQPPRAG